jgi:protein AaeX
MTGEIDIADVFIPGMLVVALAAFVATAVLKRALRGMNFYRFTWHAGLFDIALYVLAAWSIAMATSRITA